MPAPTNKPTARGGAATNGRPQQGGLVARLEKHLQAAVENHAADDTNYGRIQLPAGIVNGVAQLSKAYFGINKDGKDFYRAEGTVVEPEYATDPATGREMKIRGLPTSVMITIDEGQRGDYAWTIDDRLAEILNEFRKLGAETVGMEPSDFEEIAASLVEAAPYFNFSTVEKETKSGPNKGKKFLNEYWNGTRNVPADYTPPDPEQTGEVVDNTPKDTPKAAAAPVPKTAPKPAAVPVKTATKTKQPDPEPAEPDLDMLLIAANDPDNPDDTGLRTLAIELGATNEQCDTATSYEVVAEFITSGEWPEGAFPEEEAPAEEEAAEFAPVKGTVYLWSPIDPKTKKTVKKPFEVECTAVVPAKKSCTVKDVTTNKVTANVPFEQLAEM